MEAPEAVASDPPAATVAVETTETKTTTVVATTGPVPLTAEERKSATDGYNKALESFEKSIITIAGGGLVLSTTFVHDMAPHPVPESASALMTGWVCLILSLTLIVASMLTGHRALELYLEENSRTDYTTATTILNISSAVFLVIGLSGLGWFAQQNMFAPQAMTSAPAPITSAH